MQGCHVINPTCWFGHVPRLQVWSWAHPDVLKILSLVFIDFFVFVFFLLFIFILCKWSQYSVKFGILIRFIVMFGWWEIIRKMYWGVPEWAILNLSRLLCWWCTSQLLRQTPTDLDIRLCVGGHPHDLAVGFYFVLFFEVSLLSNVETKLQFDKNQKVHRQIFCVEYMARNWWHGGLHLKKRKEKERKLG